jgi:hypothetical protein
MQFLVIAVDIQQFVVSSALHNASFMQYADFIGILDGA